MKNIFAILFFALIALGVNAQDYKEIPDMKVGKVVNKKVFVTTAKTAGKYTIKVVSPRGELQTTPVKNKYFQANQRMDIELDTKYWRKGTYTILVEDEKEKVVKKKELVIRK